jgi:CBS domain-containing protein
MHPNPIFIQPHETLREAARKMKEADCGILPVGSKGALEGIITDRDIVIRAIGDGVDPSKEIVASCMSEKTFSCNENDNLTDAAKMMRKNQVSRLVVKDSKGNISGILSFGSILRKDEDQEEISRVIATATGRQAA